MDCDIEVREFEPKLCYYIRFWTNTQEKCISRYLPKNWLNKTPTACLQE